MARCNSWGNKAGLRYSAVRVLCAVILSGGLAGTAGAVEFWDVAEVDGPEVLGGHSLAVSPSGVPCIAYYDGNRRDLKYAWCDANDYWHRTTVDSAGDVGRDVSLAMLQSGRPGISYFDDTKDDLKYVEFIGTDLKNPSHWESTTVDNEGGSGSNRSLGVLASGDPAIAYYDPTNGDLKYAWRDPNGWHTTTVDAAGDVGAGASLGILPLGGPAIVYPTARAPS